MDERIGEEVPVGGGGGGGFNRVTSLHTFAMNEAFEHEDEGTAGISEVGVIKVMNRVKEVYTGAASSHQLAKSVATVLEKAGTDRKSTLLATSLCNDEVNRDLEDEFRTIFGNNFSMGGLAGFPFGGVFSFGAIARHIPQGGSCLIVYGPHTGIDWDGVVGKVNRRGHLGSGGCCESAIAAAAYAKGVSAGLQVKMPSPDEPTDSQLIFAGQALLTQVERLENAKDLEIELPHILFDCQKDLMDRIYNKACKDVATDGGKIAFLGGIQINTPQGTPEYFLPKLFELRNNKGEVVKDLLEDLRADIEKNPAMKYVNLQRLAKYTSTKSSETIGPLSNTYG
jgi:hypothetical protein